MKIVFIASISGKKHHEEDYRMISNLCREMGHEVFDDYTFKHIREYLEESTPATLKQNNKKIADDIKNCDILIAETTQSSTGVGRYLGIALEHHKRVLILYTEYPPRALLADPTRLVTAKKYTPGNKKILRDLLSKFFKKSEKKIFSYRFNLMISNEMNDYLYYKAKSNGISKSDYVRNLISSNMDSSESTSSN